MALIALSPWALGIHVYTGTHKHKHIHAHTCIDILTLIVLGEALYI